ncbi:hypothetical protein [Cryobacterium sp. PH31-L1]|uniref:hypothetical protein n=1 Tax=Cryobacterium sp. PH31-L1 TaxID=3046199 RepID=UPI0024B981D4|nr:hypothetical protein [Cryobacterium sp. PH31-L1]MDJ0376406.1 hypothetical protein [Cryobacterium sp. PH31-L1]
MTHILSTRRRLSTPPVLPESTRTGAPRLSPGSAWLLGRTPRPAATPTDLALARAGSESAVDTLLATLPEHWAAFTLPTLGGDGPRSMRLLVGPGGVLALHAQLCDGQIAWVHRQSVLVVGQRSPDLAVAAAGANRLTTLIRGRLPLRTAVQPALVLLGARALWVTGRSSRLSGRTPVPVLGAATLGDWLAARPQVLRPIERMELAAVIDNPLTWGSRPTILPRPGNVGDQPPGDRGGRQ